MGQLSRQAYYVMDNCQDLNESSSLYRTLAVKHEGGRDDFLPVLPGAAQVVLAVAVVHLLPRPDGVLGHEVGLREENIQNQESATF